jgi:hypothetical protein
MRFSKSVLQIIDSAIGQQLDVVDLTKQSKLAIELLQARREIRAALAQPSKVPCTISDGMDYVNNNA